MQNLHFVAEVCVADGWLVVVVVVVVVVVPAVPVVVVVVVLGDVPPEIGNLNEIH